MILFLGFFDSVVDAVRQFAIRVSGKTSALVFTDAQIENKWVLTHKQQKRVFLGFCFASTKMMKSALFFVLHPEIFRIDLKDFLPPSDYYSYHSWTIYNLNTMIKDSQV